MIAIVLSGMLLAAPGTALAAAGCPKTSTSDIADEVMCLQCGVPLNLAEEAPSAKRERAYIQQLVDRCQSKDQIKQALVAQFGSNVLADPKSNTTWLVPALAFAAAVAVLGYAAFRLRRRRSSAAAAAAAPSTPADSEAAARLQADLDRYDL
jgi:cytochrome c-type biogenesis protein CcmH/NrfF